VQSADLAWAPFGEGQERRAEWGFVRDADDPWLKLQVVSRVHQIADGGSEEVIGLWKQKLEQRQHLRSVRRTLMEPNSTLPPSPSKVNFRPNLRVAASPSTDVTSPPSPQLVQVMLFNFVFCRFLSSYLSSLVA
jgi:hypothetical protein